VSISSLLFCEKDKDRAASDDESWLAGERGAGSTARPTSPESVEEGELVWLAIGAATGVSDTDNGISRNLNFHFDRHIVADGLCVPIEIAQICRRRKSEGVTLGTNSEVKNAISTNRTGCDTSIGHDVQIRVALYSRLQYRCSEAPIGVNQSERRLPACMPAQWVRS
jgi:hypothetical protein